MGLADGATELHKIQLAKQLMRGVEPATGLFPTGHLPDPASRRRRAVRRR